MYPVSPEFLAALRGHHTVTARTEFIWAGEVVADVPILSGDVSADRTADVRRTCSLSFSPSSPELPVLPGINDYSTSPFWPIGNEIKVYAGLVFPSGGIEEVPLGRFRIAKPKFKTTNGELTIAIEGYDRSRTVARHKFTDYYQVVEGTDYATAIQNIITTAMPRLTYEDFDFAKTDGSTGGPIYTTPDLLFSPGDDPWATAMNMARDVGCEVFFDYNGVCVLRPQPDPLYTPSVFEYESGEYSVLDSVSRDLDDEETYNGVIVQGQNNDNTALVPRGEAWDLDPESPTYYDPQAPHLSEYGAVPLIMPPSDFIRTNEQAAAAAAGQLLTVVSLMESVQFDGVANYAHAEGDVITVKDDSLGVDGHYLLDSFRIGFGEGGGMSGTTRKRRVG